jgi:hypothetical protein
VRGWSSAAAARKHVMVLLMGCSTLVLCVALLLLVPCCCICISGMVPSQDMSTVAVYTSTVTPIVTSWKVALGDVILPQQVPLGLLPAAFAGTTMISERSY